jgi:hypothetical protein
MEVKDRDRELICQDCQSTFIWTVGEQRFYRELNYTQPKRCVSCRAYLKRKIRERNRTGEVQHGR